MLTGRKLLLADDSLTIQKVVSLTFGDEGMEVVAVGSGAEALRQLAGAAPDIVFADVFMPEPNGYEVCAHVKRDERLRHIPVVLLVGTFEPFNEAEARRVGADDVLTKPFQSIRELVSKVGNLLGGHAEEERKADEPTAREASDARRAPNVEQPAQASATAESVDAPAAFPWTQPKTERAAEPPPAWTPAPTPASAAGSFNDFDMDDQTIQTTPAAAFGGHAAESEAAEPFVMRQVEAEAEPAAHADETSAVAAAAEAQQPATVTAQMQPEGVAALSYAAAASTSSEFVARAGQAALADDALLDLGETATPVAVAPAAVEADDFILDLDDEPAAVQQPAPLVTEEAPRVAYAEGLASSPAEAAAPLLTEEAPHTDALALEADAQAYQLPPQSGQALESVLPDVAPDNALADTIPMMGAQTETAADEVLEPPAPFTWQETTPPAPADDFAAPGADSAPPAEEFVAPVAAESTEVSAPAASAPAVAGEQQEATQLSQETIDAIARRVVELMSDGVVREIAWEVVPDLAERLIRRRLDEERSRTH